MADIQWGGPAATYHAQASRQPYVTSGYRADYSGAVPPAAGPQPAPGEAPRSVVWGKVFQASGALVSLALILGLGVWGYKLALRDVTGVPVVTALQDPMRIEPENPGGASAAHQGLAVNEIAGAGTASDAAERIALAPEAGNVTEEDAPARPGTEVFAVPMVEPPAVQPASALMVPAAPSAPVTDAEAEAAARALADSIAQGVAPLASADSRAPVVQTVSMRPVPVIPASVPGVKRSPRPPARPADVVARASALPADLAAVLPEPAAPGVREVPISEVPSGTRLVQLGAFDSKEVAREEWDRLMTVFGELMEGKDRVIMKAQSGGKTFYRLRAMGFDDLSDARRFCSVIMAGNAPCIPVQVR